MVNSLEMTLTVTAISVLLAYPLAWIMAERVPTRLQRLALDAGDPAVLDVLCRALLLLASGAVAEWRRQPGADRLRPRSTPRCRSPTPAAATVIGFVHFFVMLLTLTIFANLKQLSPSYRRAAADLGARPGAHLPACHPAADAARHHDRRVPDLRAGIGDYITPQILGGNNELVMPQIIMMQIGRRGDFPLASALAIILMRGGDDRLPVLRPLAEDRAGLMRIAGKILVSAYALAIYGFIFLPVVVLVLFSLQATAFPCRRSPARRCAGTRPCWPTAG